mmetsp:Transcript_30434/g.56294  ORF Transcript_30434/g.56294 Transcript_30434/m.56294 type:complete len:709 (+) Transcript_30434:96-2222(+)
MGNAARTGPPASSVRQSKPEMTNVAGGDAFDAQELMRHLQEREGYEVYEFFEAEKGHRNARKLKGQSAPCVLAPRRIWAEALEEQPAVTASGDSAETCESRPPAGQVEPPRDTGIGSVVVDDDPWIVLTPTMPPPPKPAGQSKARPAFPRGPPPPPKAKAKGAPGKPPQAKAKSGAGAGGKSAPPPPPFGKKLHWKLLPANSLEDTIFEDIRPWGEVVPPLNREQLKRIFCPAPRAAPLPQRKTSFDQNEGPLAAKGRPGQQSGSQVCLIDNKRAQNLAIVLRQVSLPTDQLSEALRGMHMNQQVTADALEHVLENLVPSLSEVIDPLVSYDGPVGNLRDVEKQLLPLAKLSRLKARLRTMLFSKNMASLRDSLLARIRTLRNACEQVRTSDALKHVFRTVLRVGNYLNHGVDAPDVGGGVEVKGFAVESLLKLRDFRAAQGGEFSALHVVALHLLQAGLLDFPAQLRRELREVLEPGDAGGANVTDGGISNLRDGVDHFRGEMDQVHGELERFPSSYSQPALAVLQQLLEDAKEMAHGLEEELQEALVIAQKLLGYFGERCEVLPPDNDTCTEAVEKFFNIIREFVTSFEDCWKEVLEQPRKLRLEGVTFPGRGDSPRAAGLTVAPGRDRRDSSPTVDGQSGCGSAGQSGDAAGKAEENATGETTMAQRQSRNLAAEAIAFRRRKSSRIETLGSTRLMNAALLVQGD